MFRFVQWEFPGALGPADGRYVVRVRPGDEPERVVVIAGSDAPRRGARRARPVAPGPRPEAVPVTRATVIEAAPFAGPEVAAAWLERAAGPEAEATVAAAMTVLNEAVHAHRVAAADPFMTEVAPGGALVTRVGYGSGEQVADGRWTDARALAAPGRRGRGHGDGALAAQQRLAALLGGRDRALACEELALRARLDVERGRGREAALQTHLALEAAREELRAAGMPERLAGLEARRDIVAAAAHDALRGDVAPAASTAVIDALERLEAALRAYARSGL